MNISTKDYEKFMAGRGKTVEPPNDRRKRQRIFGFRSKLESDYARHLDLLLSAGEIGAWFYESVRLKIGNGAWFKPDFLVIDKNGLLVFFETKGYRYAAGIVRIKAAALQYPCFKFVIVTKEKGEWVENRI